MAQAIKAGSEKAATEGLAIRDHRWASGEVAAHIDLQVSRVRRGVYIVQWGVERGRGWRMWRKSGLSEAEALAFADTKWPVLMKWLENYSKSAPVVEPAV